jgi:hypothetical protein
MKKRGQFYLIATIIIVAVVIGISAILNYSTKTNFYETEKVAKELSIESEKVLDYDALHPATPQFENFARDYSSYAGDKDIYFIIVDESKGIEEAYKYTEGQRVNLTEDHLNVAGNNIQFTLDSKVYNFKLEEGKNFYFVLIYDKGEERYVYTG